jgi:hypothetical protein
MHAKPLALGGHVGSVAMSMERFVRLQNVQHFRRLLETATDRTQRDTILILLADEQQKQKDADDPEAIFL